MNQSNVVALSLVLALGCGATTQKPVEEPTVTETTSATADMPATAVKTTEPVIETPAADPVDAEAAQARGLALSKAQDFAKTFRWSEKPILERLPAEAPVGSVGEDVFVIHEIRLAIDEKRGTWDFEARGGESDALGVSIALKGTPKAGRKYNGTMGHNMGYFQAPQVGKSIKTTEFSDTLSVNGDNAFAIEITKLTIDKSGTSGKASGKFVSMYKADGDYPAMWAAGTFADAKVRITKK